MVPAFPLVCNLPSPDATAALASSVAPHLVAGDVLLLSGDIGAGKTHFARALIQSRLSALGKPEDVPSPTFTIIQTYQDADVEIWHADLYRLTNAFEVVELGLTDAFRDAICLVEWPENLGQFYPANALKIDFSAGNTDDARVLGFETTAPRWNEIIPSLIQFGACSLSDA